MEKRKRRWLIYLSLSTFLFSMPLTANMEKISPSLHQLARRGQSELVEMLLENGASPEKEDTMHRTALHHGAIYPSVVSVLLEYGADPNARDRFGNTPLHKAVMEYESVRLLIEAGADVTAKNDLNQTPLDIALNKGASRRNRKTVRQLLQAGAR